MLLASKLRQARQEADLTQQRAAELATLEPNTIWRYEAGRREPSASTLETLANTYNKPIDWFFGEENGPTASFVHPGTAEPESPPTPDAGAPLDEIKAGIAKLEAFLSAHSPGQSFAKTLSNYDLSRLDPSDRSPVEVLEVASAAGTGTEVYDETAVGLLWFRNDWLQRCSIDPRKSHIISVRGESMEPTLPDGCSILVDRNRREPHEDGVYVMRTEEGLVVKRLGLDDRGRWELLSDNPHWEPTVMSYGTDIIGEVRWYAVTL